MELLAAQDYRFIAIDVETANGDASSICQIGLALITHDGTLTSYSQLVDPQADFHAMNISIHGIDPEMVVGAPTFEDEFSRISPLLNRHDLIQHSSFDKRAMNQACARHDLPELQSAWHDSVMIARRAWPELKGNGGHGLAHLKKFLDLDFRHHDAGEDARAAAEITLLAEERLGKSFAEILGRKK